ncbi:DUF6850 family outer membrane beta-barrel protein [Candidatus Palauibacter sp.]|uniref:DUF6850 family outer membrane beta-barrel protein n=1 Tax=Candidatus Palauibacter sp. TaxID=3101350 RepID=UPI003B59A4E6
MTNWSPLSRIADLPRHLPAGARFPGLLSTPAPRVGEFWTAGNSAALARELDDRRADFRLAWRTTSGHYARPLDPGGVGRGEVSTTGWTQVGRRGAAIGSAIFDRTSLRDSIFADVLLPYGSNPLIVVDTIGDPLRKSALRLEGALGWEFGRFGVGLAAGWEGQSSRTVVSPVPRLDRTATPGFSAGLSYDLGPLRLGLLGRMRYTAEFIRIQTVAQPSRVFQFEGYAEPIPLDLHPARYERRHERDSHSFGASAAFAALGADWALYGLREQASEAQFVRLQESDPAKDMWDAEGWKFGLAGQWAFRGARDAEWFVTVESEYRTLEGEAFQASIGDIIFTAEESRLDLGVDTRLRFANGWLLGGRAEVRQSRRDRHDLFAEATSDIRGTEGGGALELGRGFGQRLAISAGAQVAIYGPSGTMPNPDARGPEYGRFVGPGLALDLNRVLVTGGVLTLRWQTGATTGLWFRSVLGSLSPRETQLPLTPTGNRRAWAVTVGVVLDEVLFP